MISKKMLLKLSAVALRDVLGCVLLGVALCACGVPQMDVPTAPHTNDGEKWRIAYYQGGDYIDYASNLRGLVSGLVDLGWMEPLEIPAFDDPEDAEAVWRYVAAYAESDTLDFGADAFWSAGWDEVARGAVRQAAITRLSQGGDIDLVIAMGTWAGQDLVNDAHHISTVALTSSDPIEAGIIETVEDSGYDHVLVEVDPNRYRRQIRLYHDIVGFKRLGVVYEDSADGRVYANLSDLEYVAQEKGFTLVHCHAPDLGADEGASLDAVNRCYAELAPGIDALWIGAHTGEQPKFMPAILEPMFINDVPTWTSIGPPAVKRGVLLSISYTDFAAVGHWYATIIAKILNGAQPRALNQVYEMPGQIVVNLETARRIGFQVPEGILAIADEVYERIEGE